PNRSRPPLGQLDQAGNVAADQFLADSPRERGAQDGAHDLYLAYRVALFKPLVEEPLNGGDGQGSELLASQAGNQVQTDVHLIEGVGGRPSVRLDEVLQPVIEVRAELPHLVGNRHACAGILLGLAHLVARLLTCPSRDGHAPAAARDRRREEGSDPAAVPAPIQRAIAVMSALTGRLSLSVRWHLTHFLILLFECSYVLVQGIDGDEPEFAVLDRANPVRADQVIERGFAHAEYERGLTRPVKQLVHAEVPFRF